MARLVMTLMAIGEALVGVALLAIPGEVVRLLIDATLDARGLIVARMMGVAVLALGITWWKARSEAALPPYAPGFTLYNIGVGALFGWAALDASQPVLPGIVCVAHLGAGAAFTVLVQSDRSARK